jgi:muramoyltetrapeptide carboxypeptidase
MSWSKLLPGDIVDVVAPGSACKPEALQNGIRFLESWGLRPRVSRNIFGGDVICSNTDAVRFAQLKSALLAPDSKAVWCVRGGYGAIRIVPELVNLRAPKIKEKLFIGYSDITTVNVFLNQEWGWSAIHGPMLDRLGQGLTAPKYVKELKDLVFGNVDEIGFFNLKPLNASAKKKGEIRAGVSGGNLVTLQSSIGTKAEWDPKGKIIFFEEIGERGYRLDRIFEQFSQGGTFDRCKAVILGDFIGGEERDGTSQVDAVIKRFADTLKVPVFKGLKAGHGEIQRPLPLGTAATLTMGGTRSSLVCSTGCER